MICELNGPGVLCGMIPLINCRLHLNAMIRVAYYQKGFVLYASNADSTLGWIIYPLFPPKRVEAHCALKTRKVSLKG